MTAPVEVAIKRVLRAVRPYVPTVLLPEVKTEISEAIAALAQPKVGDGEVREAMSHLDFVAGLPGVHPHRITAIRALLERLTSP